MLFIAIGVPATALSSGLITGTQQASPPDLRGRLLSLLAVAQALGQATGILAAGLLSASTSLTALLNAQAGCYLVCALIAIVSFDLSPRGRGSRSASGSELRDDGGSVPSGV